jgi:hypothetical protein
MDGYISSNSQDKDNPMISGILFGISIALIFWAFFVKIPRIAVSLVVVGLAFLVAAILVNPL